MVNNKLFIIIITIIINLLEKKSKKIIFKQEIKFKAFMQNFNLVINSK